MIVFLQSYGCIQIVMVTLDFKIIDGLCSAFLSKFSALEKIDSTIKT